MNDGIHDRPYDPELRHPSLVKTTLTFYQCRRGSGPKKKHNVPQGQQTTTICIDLNVYVRWWVIKVRLGLRTPNDVAEYLLNAAELLDNATDTQMFKTEVCHR